MSLKQRTAGGLIWSTIDAIGLSMVRIVIAIIIARLLMPSDFGLFALVSIIIAFSDTLLHSGFDASLVRKINITDKDYSTIFVFNVLFAATLYLLIFTLAPFLANSLSQPLLKPLARVTGLVVVLHSFGIVQRAGLKRALNFKALAVLNIASTIFSGATGIILAHRGFGVWSLAAQGIVKAFLTSILLWYLGRWKLRITFCFSTFKEHFNFSYKLTIGAVINSLSDYFYKLLIGIYYSTDALGYYHQAKKLSGLPSSIVFNAFKNVSYPVLSSLQNNMERLQKVYISFVRLISFVTIPLMFLLILIAHPLLMLLLTDKWATSIPFFRLFCIKGIFFSLLALNANIFKVVGRTDISLKLQVFYNIQRIVALIITAPFGIKAIIIGLVVQHFLQYFFNCWVAYKLIRVPVIKQISQSLRFLIVALTISLVIYPFRYVVLAHSHLLIIQTSIFISLYLLIHHLLKTPELKEIIVLVKSKYNQSFNNNSRII